MAYPFRTGYFDLLRSDCGEIINDELRDLKIVLVCNKDERKCIVLKWFYTLP